MLRRGGDKKFLRLGLGGLRLGVLASSNMVSTLSAFSGLSGTVRSPGVELVTSRPDSLLTSVQK